MLSVKKGLRKTASLRKNEPRKEEKEEVQPALRRQGGGWWQGKGKFKTENSRNGSEDRQTHSVPFQRRSTNPRPEGNRRKREKLRAELGNGKEKKGGGERGRSERVRKKTSNRVEALGSRKM